VRYVLEQLDILPGCGIIKTTNNILKRGILSMKISPYIAFNGNCKEAVSFYEKAFNVTAEVMFYKDAPPAQGYETTSENENLVMHAQFSLDDEVVMLCDMPPQEPAKVGNNITVMLEFDTVTAATAVFNALKEGGEVCMELQETFWSKCFGSLTDKFGINWNISIGCPTE
jgi:PhnB protein